MTAVVAAIITATVALLVVIVDRVAVATIERRRAERAARRLLYARFLASSRMANYYIGIQEQHSIGAVATGQELNQALAEMELVASEPVIKAAEAMVEALVKRGQGKEPSGEVPDYMHAAREAFTKVAREEKPQWRER